MKKNIKRALKHVLVHEGGWADHPRDPGGPTMKGVTLRTYRRHFGSQKSKQDLRNMSEKELEKIYRSGYWDKCHCDELPSGVDYAVFDAAVNSGPSRSARWLQAAVGAKQDGGIGEITLQKLSSHEPSMVCDTMCDRRLGFLRGLSTWSTFGKGWGRRVEGVRSRSMEMAGSEIPEIIPSSDFRTTRYKSSGSWVEKLQAALKIHVDGKFGRDTEKVLIDWQRENGLEPDGIAGRVTYRALGLIF